MGVVMLHAVEAYLRHCFPVACEPQGLITLLALLVPKAIVDYLTKEAFIAEIGGTVKAN